MKRSPRLAALIAALMLLATCTAVTPSQALLGPIKDIWNEDIGEPEQPGGGRARYSDPGMYLMVPLPGYLLLLKLNVRAIESHGSCHPGSINE